MDKYIDKWYYIDKIITIECNGSEYLRIGQTLFNVVYALYPKIADKLRGTEYDCFYQDSLCLDFMREVEKLWEEEYE